METLPPEMVCEVARHLNVKDLLACVAVSRQWREIFGSDEIWRPWCDVDAEEHLRTTPCQVEPKFQSPQAEDSTLSPIGRWRAAHIRERHLLKNWIQGNFVEDEMTESCIKVVFLNNDFVITISKDRCIRLLNTSMNPSVCVAVLPFPTTVCDLTWDVNFDIFTIQNDKFIFFDNSKSVSIIQVDWKSYALKVENSFCLDQGNLFYAIIKNKLVMVEWGGCELHVWDVDNCFKLKTVSLMDSVESDDSSLRVGKCSIDDTNYLELIHDESNENVGIIGSIGNSRECFFFVYSVKHLKFLPFKIQTDVIQNFVLGEKYVTLAFSETTQVYNYHTSQCLYSLESYGCLVWPMGNSVLFTAKPNKLMRLSSKGGLQCLETNVLFSKISGSILYYSKKRCIALMMMNDDDHDKYENLLMSLTSSVSIINFSTLGAIHGVNQACSKMNLYKHVGNASHDCYHCLRFYW